MCVVFVCVFLMKLQILTNAISLPRNLKNKQVNAIFELFSKRKTNGACGQTAVLLGVVFSFSILCWTDA